VSDGVSVLYGEELELDFTARGEAELSWDGPTSMARMGRASSAPAATSFTSGDPVGSGCSSL
jgi:hypothetical protein